jgi:hypothetical protein
VQRFVVPPLPIASVFLASIGFLPACVEGPHQPGLHQVLLHQAELNPVTELSNGGSFTCSVEINASVETSTDLPVESTPADTKTADSKSVDDKASQGFARFGFGP